MIFALTIGGAEVVLLELVRALDPARFRPVVISLAPPGSLTPRFVDAGIEVHYLGMERIAQAPFVLLRALALTRRLEPRIVHGVLFYGDLTARLVRLFGQTSHVVGAIHSTYIGPRAYEKVMRWTDTLADAVTAVSEAAAQAQVAAGSVPAAKVEVIPNGIDVDTFKQGSPKRERATRSTLGIDDSDRVLLCVGRLAPEKNHASLLRVFAKLVKRFARLKLLLVGSGTLEVELRRLSEDLAVSHQVVFTGSVSPVAPVLDIAEIFVLPSVMEGLPMAMLEAMAAAKAMVVTSVGGIPEVVEHGRSALIVPPSDDEALERALVTMLTATEDERAQFGAEARKVVEDRYSVRHMVAQTQELYERLLRSP